MTTKIKPGPTLRSSTKIKSLFDNDIANRFSLFRREFIHNDQVEAARLLGIAQSNLSLIENGKRAVNSKIVNKLIRDFDLNNEWLVTGHGEKRSHAKDTPTAAASLQAVRTDVNTILKGIKMMEATTNHLIRVIERQDLRIEKLEKELLELKSKK